MLSNWKIDLVELTAEHVDGYLIKKVSSINPDDISYWHFEKGNYNSDLLKEGILCFEHHYAKSFLMFYMGKFSVDEIVDISNKYIKENSYGDFISKCELERYINNEDLFKINTISIIRAALYFYNKRNKQKK